MRLKVLLLAIAVASASVAAAAPSPEIAAICDRAAAHGAAHRNVPVEVLRALTRTETGRASGGVLQPWPWTVNMEGEGFWFDTREEALAFVRARHAGGARSYDVGCFQINYRWHGEAFTSIEAMFDPEENARYAAEFLTDLAAEGGGWRAAIGRYHSRTPSLAAKYTARFERIFAQLGPTPKLAPAPVPTSPRRAPASPRIALASAGAAASPGGFFAAAPPAHAAAGAARASWRGGVTMTMFGGRGGSLLTPARPLFD